MKYEPQPTGGQPSEGCYHREGYYNSICVVISGNNQFKNLQTCLQSDFCLDVDMVMLGLLGKWSEAGDDI